MFDPLTNLGSLLGILLEILGTIVSAFFLPAVQLIVYPLATVIQTFS